LAIGIFRKDYNEAINGCYKIPLKIYYSLIRIFTFKDSILKKTPNDLPEKQNVKKRPLLRPL